MRESPDPSIDDVWRSQRAFVLDIAYRMLGSISDAEDVAQEAFMRLLRVDLDEIDDVRAWLVVVVSRLCLDHLRSARIRRERAAGAWLPEPLVDPAPADPADRITLDDSVRMALLVVLEQLSPAERAAFVLHDVFQFSFETVGDIVGRSPAACRQLASRARRRIEADVTPARFSVAPEQHRAVVDRFIAACTTGDIAALTEVLDEHVEGVADFGGGVHAGAAGVDEVSQRLVLLFGPASDIVLEARTVNGGPGVIALLADRVMGVSAFTIVDGRITEIHSIVDPAKLTHVDR